LLSYATRAAGTVVGPLEETHARAIKQMRASHKRTRAHALSQMNRPLFLFAEELPTGARTRSRRNESIGTHARARTQLLALQLLLADHHAGREPRSKERNASTRGHHAVSHQATRAPRILPKEGREPEPGVLTRESYRLAIHIVKPHNAFTHCPDRRLAVKSEPTTGVLLGATGRGIYPTKGGKTRRETPQTNRSEAHWGLSRANSIVTTGTTLKLTAAH